MSNVMGMCRCSVAVIGIALAGAQARAADAADAASAAWLGSEPIAADELASKRGGTDVHNTDMQLQGYVAENQAINVATGNNSITDGSFAGAAGVPMVVQNTGNNVLIQNATILNIQVK